MELQAVAAPESGYGELLVDVSFAGVNFRDIYERRGGYGPPPPVVGGSRAWGGWPRLPKVSQVRP